jgi:phosphatidylserine/phosphatidylglycerophosphate/cardiolipin synthase-like enzyme
MDEILAYLQTSISDEFFSKAEKRTFKSILTDHTLDTHQISFLKSKIYELAHDRITESNYKFILDWVKNANSTLTPQAQEISDAYFSPGDACRNVIVNQIEKATKQLNICVFTISDDTITSGLLLAHKKGVNIKIITDNDKSFDEGSDIKQLSEVGISIKMDSTPNHMHHKFMVVDQGVLITGSYNWTRSAARYNHENILLTKEAGVIKSFSSQFEKLWNEMENY